MNKVDYKEITLPKRTLIMASWAVIFLFRCNLLYVDLFIGRYLQVDLIRVASLDVFCSVACSLLVSQTLMCTARRHAF